MFNLPGYSIDQKLYESARSLVYRAHRETDHSPVILKALNELYPSPERVARFKREYELTSHLELECVARSLALEKYQQAHVIVMEDCGGESLDKFLENGRFNPFHPHPDHLQTITQFLNLAIQLTQSLGAIYQHNIIHKDINPANIVWNTVASQVKLIDFGISTTLSRENPVFRNPNVLEGTLAYMSPEQTGRMNQGIDYRTDFYSLGATLYELLTGQLPFESNDPLELVHAHIARQPAPPHELNTAVPIPISNIVLKLLAKNAQDRYQSAAGLAADWQNCLRQWQENGRIQPFPLGLHDISDRFHVSQQLYGRMVETNALLEAFEQVCRGHSMVMLVTGQAGIGKSALVQEVYKPLSRQRGYFIAGKFDQFQRHIPYASLIQAFHSLIQQLLTETEAQIQTWRKKITAVLGSNAQLIIDVLPEVELIIGPQPPIEPLPPTETENRFNRVFQNFIQVFTQAEHPLVIFLDDLQWADSASLKLLRLLVAVNNSQYLFLIGAYRDNEVETTHPLALLLKEIQPPPITLSLAALTLPHVTQLVIDTLHCPPAEAEPLAEIIRTRTGGNPFFIGEFLKALHTDNLLQFNYQTGRWVWDLNQIQTQAITDNVVELMATKVQKLPLETQQTLKQAACIGNLFDLATLSIATKTSHQETAVHLWPAISEGLLFPLNDSYKFVALADADSAQSMNVEYKFAHDRIQQAVYSLIPDDAKALTHLQIGRIFLQYIPAEKQEQKIFDIVYQLNQGQQHITPGERPQLAQLNLQAGQKAKASTAYRQALTYLQTGLNLVSPNSWQSDYPLVLALHLEATETAYLCGEYAEMERLANLVLQHAHSVLDKVRVYETQIQAYRSQDKLMEAVKVGVAALRPLNVNLPDAPTRLDTVRHLIKTRYWLFGRSPDQLLNQPELTDPNKLAAFRLLMSMSSAAFLAYPEMYPLIVLYMVRLSARFGNSPLSAFSYATYGLILSGFLNDIKGGQQFGQLALSLLERYPNKETAARVRFVRDFSRHWLEPVRYTLPTLIETYQTALENGDLEFAAYALYTRGVHLYTIDIPLPALERELTSFSRTMRQTNQETMLRLNDMHRQCVLNFMQETAEPWHLIGEAYDETQMLPIHLASNDRTGLATLHYRRLLLACFFQNYHYALENANAMQQYMDSVRGSVGITQFYFYDAIICLSLAHETKDSAEKKQLLRRAAERRKKMGQWAKLSPENYLCQHHTLEAEWARLNGQEAMAREHYDKAIAMARQYEQLYKEALTCELAARFYVNRNQPHLARHYVQDAYYAYQQWGSAGKLKDLEARYPEFLLDPKRTATTTVLTTARSSTIQRATNILDLTSVIKASQTISGEIVPDKLLAKLMNLVMENAGAQRGCLILEQAGQWAIEAESQVDEPEIAVLQSLPVQTYPLPVSIVNYVIRTKENVVLNDATEGSFANDPYVAAKRPKSILCAPLLNQGKLTGVLYLENNLTTAAFTPDRLEVLTLLSSQAAISLENAFLYANLEKRVAERTAELSETNEFLTASNAELDAFAHTVAHDLKNPLGVMIGYAELLQEILEDRGGDAEIQKFLDAIARGGRKMRDIINALLVLSRLHRQQEIETFPLDMGRIVREVQQRLDFMIIQYEATVIAPDNWPVAVGYSAWIEEVWVNYFTNALKYGGRPPMIELGATLQEDDMVRFWVRDNGEGLTPEQQTQLFTPFTRVTQAKVEGHGLGLSIVQRIVHRLGGRVGVESIVGQGSTFYFTLPCQR